MDTDRLKLILDVATEGFWDWDLKADRAYLSPRYCDLIGYSPDETVFDSSFLKKIIHPDDHHHVFSVIDEHLQGNRAISVIEYRMFSKDGSIRWIEGRGKVVEYDEQGQPARMVGTVIDITERKLAERELVDNNRFLAEMIEYSGMLIAVKDQEGHYQRVNRRWEQVTGLSRQDVLGRSDEEIFPYPIGRDLRNNDLEAMESGLCINKEEIIDDETLGRRYGISTKFPLKNKDGSIKGVCVMSTDITDRKEAELRLQRSEEEFRLTFDGAADAIFWADVSTGILTNCNKAAEDMMEVPREEIIGKHQTWLHPPEMAELFEALFKKSVTISEPVGNVDAIVVSKSGKRIPVNIKHSVTCVGGREIMQGVFRDISEQTRLTEALDVSRRQLEMALALTNSSVFDADFVHNRITVTPGLFSYLGYTAEELPQTMVALDQLIHQDDRVVRKSALELHARGERTLYYTEVRFRAKNGDWVWCSSSGKATERGDNGSITRLVGVATDITGRKQIEEKLRLSEERFSTAFRVSPDAINITRLNDGMYLEVNEGFTALTGYTSGDVVGRTSLELNLWDNPEDRARLASGLKERGVVNNLEAQFRRKDGSSLIGLMSARIIEIDGESCLISITRDISDRKQSEVFLRESEQNLRMLMDSMPAGVWWFNSDGKVEYLNNSFSEQFGYTLDDIPTLDDWFERAYPDLIYRGPYIAARNASIAEAVKSGTAVPPREALITCKNGTQRHIIINTKFALGCTVEIFTDITEREHLHDQLQRIDKLESLGILAGGIAHDFNNILTGIIGNISFARRYLDETHKSASILLKAEKAATRAADLAHQLLTFAKGGQPIKKTVSVRHLLEETTSFVLRGSNVSSDIRVTEDLVAVEADEGQISQVINNLIINASHAMPGGGTITVRGENILMDAANKLALSPGMYAKLTVTDTGCGISEEIQNKIFDPYFTTKPGGSGLGLASAHSIITKHGGYIGVSSVVGRGSTFELLLPASDKNVTYDCTDCVSEIIDGQAGLSVLVMDDEEMIRELAALMIEEVGYHAQTCANGKEVIALYKAARDAGSPYSVVIMDLTVPGGMGGREAAEHILKIDPNARLIVSSGYSTDPVMSEFGTFGFCATLLKPYSIEEITKTLATVLSKIQKR